MDYLAALEVQTTTLDSVLAGSCDTLLLVEHTPVLTLGAGFHAENLLHEQGWYEERGIQVLPTDRGGDVTYHGPGQLVAYPIFDVSKRGKDLHKWMRDLEEAVIRSLGLYGWEGKAFRSDVNSGVWTENGKLCAIGIKLRRWVSMHGIAINCDLDLSVFGTFVPCGLKGYGVTSLSREIGRPISIEEWKPWLVKGFEEVFDA